MSKCEAQDSDEIDRASSKEVDSSGVEGMRGILTKPRESEIEAFRGCGSVRAKVGRKSYRIRLEGSRYKHMSRTNLKERDKGQWRLRHM